MEIERDFKIEYGGNAETGASAGARAATSMPRFTRKELEAGLGPTVSKQIEGLFRGLTKAKRHRADGR
jgi:hypothetical protein